MDDYGGPGPGGGADRGGRGRRWPRRGRGPGRQPGYHQGDEANTNWRDPRNASQPPQGRGFRAQQRNRSNPGSLRESRDINVYESETYDHNLLQNILENNANSQNARQRYNQDKQQNGGQQQNKTAWKDRPMGFKALEDISRSDSVDIIERINQQKKQFTCLLESPVDKKKQDVFALVLELITNVWKSTFEESKKLLLLEICNSKFIEHLQLYLMQLPYATSREDKYFNKYYWTKEMNFWTNFMNFCEFIINVSPSTAVRKCGSLIDGSSKVCLEGLKEKHGFELPEEYESRMTKIRNSLKTCDDEQTKKPQKNRTNEMGEPLESFRELSILPTPEELIADRPFLRPNVVKGAYVDKEHYLDVQFRLLREDCFGPLREGIHQLIENPKRKKYDHIRVYQNVKFLEPFVSKQKIGSVVLLDENTMKRFKKINWAHSKRFLFGSLVLFTKDNCKSFLIGTILERDEKYLSKRQLPVSLVDAAVDSKIYNDDSYTMIECEVYFEPYYHVLKALQDPNFPEHLAMSSYIIDVKEVPEKPAYINPDTTFTVLTKDLSKVDFKVLEEKTWPSETMLGLNSTQYEAYKLALTHEFAVIQGPPGTGKTFLGVKIAETLLNNSPSHMLVICFTNHALDQFLEALLPVTSSMARIGGRSRNEALEAYNINKLRRKDDSRYFHERRLDLKSKITDVERAQASLDALNTSVLNYNSIIRYAEECKIIRSFYNEKDVRDPLKQWLFEDLDIEPAPMIVQQIENEENNATEVENANQDADEDIYDRDDLILDDLYDDEPMVFGLNVRLGSANVSFSLSQNEELMNELLKEYKKIQNNGGSVKKQQELQEEILDIYPQIKRFKDMMQYQTRTPEVRLANVQDVPNIPIIERWSLYFQWANLAIEDLKKLIKRMEKQVKSAAEAYEEARMMVDLAVLKRTKVVGMTTSGAARLRKVLTAIKTPIVVVEEAAEVLEAHIVTSLTKYCQHLILIGDHQQLRPSAAYMRLARHYELEVSLFERMIRNGVHSRRLGVQHRMRPELAALVCPHIYEDLRNHPSVEEFPPVKGLVNNLFFFTHDHPEQCDDDSSSRTNTFEGDMALRLANYLMQQGYQPQDVTILAAYSGQMFYLRKQRPLYHHLSNVKITVLDNYQGEESKIILLSLVRNISSDSIGFLGTENRICVALSRAREGFYIFGNIELLKRKSTLWTKIAGTLEENGSLGKTLKLKCSNHGDRITKIENVGDFVNVPEGGCLLDCKYNLPCGHPCPRVCHAYDLVHANVKCVKRCDRKICDIENHPCPLECAMKCQPCKRSVEKSLPCGHNKVLPCHVEPGDPAVYCSFVVSITLPDCGHEAKKACSMKIQDVRCKEKCPNSRLGCGHACRRTCHVNDDPDHERYTCMKPCPKANKGCTANLEHDLGEHKCLRACSEECLDCNVQVVKKRSGCTHKKRVACHQNVDATPCREKCARSLPCTHFCKKLCFEKCGDCKQKTKKKIPGCGHEIEIECGLVPTREHCKRKCERVMTCGHVCPGRCDQPCDKTKCNKIMERSFDSPCGHKVKLPCHMFMNMFNGGIAPEKLLEYCTAPCGVILRCKHSCGGTCAGCRQGRLHAPCAAVCQQLNICGHRCEEPCSQVCPPCPKRCEVKCQHSQCSQLCGAPCVSCTEPCARGCPHSNCARACGAACERAPCEQPCRKLQPCGHPCRGLCGEPCPRACRICDPEHFPTNPFMLGDPYDDDDILIQLQDCSHILDVETLDNFMKSETETIQIPQCPMCRKPIVNTYRYKDMINKMLRNDINPIKEKVYGKEPQRILKRGELLRKIVNIDMAHKLAFGNQDWKLAYEVIVKAINQTNKRTSLLQLDMYHIYLDLLETLGEYNAKYIRGNLSDLKAEMESQMKLLCTVLITNKQKISQQQQADLGNEMKRLNSIIQLSTIRNHSSYKISQSNPNVAQASKDATVAVLTWRIYSEATAVQWLKRLQDALKVSGIVSKEERNMVVRAVGVGAGNWYKCPNGHFYCVGECGAARQSGRCVECGLRIGLGGLGMRMQAGML
ncbi:hypothetical protein MSG28_010165 [Choristoneura fumiferana]|uniref:Uncharacterized protein n=1 Tax=Choristoneura fumiferana TaxID=7141 RepID=A0ACC0KKC2_CHOFU|nr:hypothetical protein MSG28_010165 [Choristoneura fumiferana]